MAGWTDEKTERFIELCDLGLVYREIGARLGCSGNSCNAKARRLGVSNGCQAGSRQKRKPKAEANSKKINSNQSAVFGDMGALSNGSRPCGKALVVVESGAQTKDVESLEPVTLLEREEHQCGWPLGDPRFADFRYCGNEKKDGHAHYCEGHAGVERQKLRRRKNIVPENRDQRAGQSSALQGWF